MGLLFDLQAGLFLLLVAGVSVVFDRFGGMRDNPINRYGRRYAFLIPLSLGVIIITASAIRAVLSLFSRS